MSDHARISSLHPTPLVLVVDDNPTSRRLACRGVEIGGMRVEEAVDGERALEAFSRGGHDLVVLDVMMPGLSGFEVCERLRAQAAGASVPVLIMTSLSDGDSIERAFECGATDFIVKPISPSLLAHRVRYMLRAARAEQELRQRNHELGQSNAELTETRTQLLQSEKMASIGQLAAGVAHEINNPIGYVKSNLGTLETYLRQLFELMQEYERGCPSIGDSAALSRIAAAQERVDLPFLTEDVFALLRESREGVTRVGKIVQDLKDFSHVSTDDEWCWANLHEGLDSTISIVNNEIKYKAELIRNYGTLPEIECLPSQLNQVFMNVLVNAAQSIETKGVITVSSGMSGAHNVRLEISDTGQGIAPEHLDRIFDPFFTTKPVGKGTGLGLSLSYGIIRKHRGNIEIQSKVGAGTTFRITLPVSQETASAAGAAARPQQINAQEKT